MVALVTSAAKPDVKVASAAALVEASDAKLVVNVDSALVALVTSAAKPDVKAASAAVARVTSAANAVLDADALAST